MLLRLSLTKKRLISQSLLSLTLIILIYFDFRPPFFEPSDLQQIDQDVLGEDTSRETFLDAVEALEYMYNSQKGMARIDPVVEEPLDVVGLSRCSGYEQEGQRTRAGSRQWTRNGNVHVFSAYLDNRPNSLFPGIPSVQVMQTQLVQFEGLNLIASSFGIGILNRTYYCHFRHFASINDGQWEGSVVKAHIRWIWQRAWDPRNEFYNAFLITCPAKDFEAMGNSLSLVLISQNQYCINSDPQRRANFTKIIKTPVNSAVVRDTIFGLGSDQIKIAVCVKGLAFLDESELSARKAVEWVALQRELGADALTVYIYWVPDRIRRALQRMANLGYLEMIDLDLPGNSPNHPFVRHQFIMRNRQQKRRYELIPYNDCLHKYSSTHHFVLIVDIDEVVIPRWPHRNWQQLLYHILGQGHWRAEPSSISIRNVFKFWNKNDNSTENRSLFANRWRSGMVQQRDQYGKSFVNTQAVASVFNHFALHRLHPNVSRTMHVGENEALKLHWKRECPEAELGAEKCRELRENRVEDGLMDRFRRNIDGTVRKIMAEL